MSCRTYDPCLDSKLNQIGSYASVARQSAQASQASATQSQTSATASATSATNSQNSANDAADSASDANNYLTQVTNIFNEFEEKYLGAFAIAPTTDNQGDPLQVGALYWNSVTNAMFVWNGSAWSPIQTSQLYLGGFAVAPTLNNQGLPLVSGNLYWNTASNNLWAWNGTAWVRTNFNETTTFLATGTTTARNLVTRFTDVVNVLDYGLVDTPSNTTATIQNAINLNPGKTIFFPDRIYTTNATIYVRSNGTKLRGDGVNTGIYANHSGDGIVFEPTTAGVTSAYLSGAGIESLFVTRAIAGNGGNAIWVRQCSGFVAQNVRANNHDYGFRISGGQLNGLFNCAASASSPYTAPAGDCAGILLERADYGVGLSQPCYTVRIDNFTGGPFPKELWKYVILVRDIDGLQISNCYINFANTALLKFQRQSGGTVAAIIISNVYFDTMFNPANAIRIQNESGVTGYGVSALSITNSFIGNNNTQNLYLIDFRSYGERVNFSNNVIANSGDFALHINDTSEVNAIGSYTFTGNTFSNTSSDNPSGGAAYINNASNVCFSGNNFLNTVTSGYQVLLTGKTDNASFVGNTTDSSTGNALLNTTGLTVNRQLIVLDASDDRANITKFGDAELRITSVNSQKPQITLNRPLGASWQIINNSGLFELNAATPGIDSAKTNLVRMGAGTIDLNDDVRFRATTTTVNAANAYLDPLNDNFLYRSSSSIKYKKDIEPIDENYSEKVLELQPVWYRSKCEADNSEWSYWGLIAEDVEKIDPRLVTYGYEDEDFETIEVTKENGDIVSERVVKPDAIKKPMGVQYDRVPVLMLDIIKKQQKQIEELSAKVEALESK